MVKVRYILLLFSVVSQIALSQVLKGSYSDIRKSYEKKDIDDQTAMPSVKSYIQKAKSDANYRNLIQGYRDGRQFDLDNKMLYADSALNTSMRYGTPDDVSKDYLSKGIIYYYYHKNYRKALNEYIQAYKYSRETTDQYQKYKVLYHMGIVRSHLGLYDEALVHFKDCLAFYEQKINTGLHENEAYNYRKAYYNTLHQITVIYQYKKNYEVSDSLSRLGYKLTYNNKDFALENSYFLKCEGISNYYHRDYADARNQLMRSLPMLINQNDFSWVTVVYYYLGKVERAHHDSDRAVRYFEKVDSIFNKQQFLNPGAFPSYTYLIEYYRNKQNIKKQLYYTNQFLKADSLITRDYPYLAETLHKEYDRRRLMDEKLSLEKSGNRKVIAGRVMLIIAVVIMLLYIYRYRKEKKIRKKYEQLQEKLEDPDAETINFVDTIANEKFRKTALSNKKSDEIKTKLEKFEKEFLFLRKSLTEKTAADLLETNSHYLSVYINENMGMNFNRYVAMLRIKYITQQLNTNPQYLNYSVEALSQECGIAARQNFSDLFFEINRIRPRDFIKNRRKDLGLS